jgi:hypothetical protein
LGIFANLARISWLIRAYAGAKPAPDMLDGCQQVPKRLRILACTRRCHRDDQVFDACFDSRSHVESFGHNASIPGCSKTHPSWLSRRAVEVRIAFWCRWWITVTCGDRVVGSSPRCRASKTCLMSNKIPVSSICAVVERRQQNACVRRCRYLLCRSQGLEGILGKC